MARMGEAAGPGARGQVGWGTRTVGAGRADEAEAEAEAAVGEVTTVEVGTVAAWAAGVATAVAMVAAATVVVVREAAASVAAVKESAWMAEVASAGALVDGVQMAEETVPQGPRY